MADAVPQVVQDHGDERGEPARVDVLLSDRLAEAQAAPADIGYFHAYYRQELPAVGGRHYEILDVKGEGHLVGALLSVVQTEQQWFGEGDDLFYVDDSPTPVMEGTGTEDYFNDAWSLRVSNGLFTGVPIAEGQGVGARLSGYRWHLIRSRFPQEIAKFLMHNGSAWQAAR